MSIANQGFLVYKSGTEHKQNNNPDATVFWNETSVADLPPG